MTVSRGHRRRCFVFAKFKAAVFEVSRALLGAGQLKEKIMSDNRSTASLSARLQQFLTNLINACAGALGDLTLVLHVGTADGYTS